MVGGIGRRRFGGVWQKNKGGKGWKIKLECY